MREINFSADELVSALLNAGNERNVCILDSCGINNLGSHLLIAGINPVEILEITNKNPDETLEILDNKLLVPDFACVFTMSYDFGLKLEKINSRKKEFNNFNEPDLFLAFYDCLIVHDYNMGKTFIAGNEEKFDEIEKELLSNCAKCTIAKQFRTAPVSSNFTRESYIAAVEQIKEFIRQGDTYQTNLTQQLRAELPENLSPQEIFQRLRKNHPAPFAAFIERESDFVVSISPERFFKVQDSFIETSPIKGTRPRGNMAAEDIYLRNELINSAKDRAENVMIVDLLRNDLGRICRFGSVEVVKLFDLEAHPTLFHLVSTIKGELRDNLKFSDIIRAVFPCGSITGAPKIRTMQIIDELETAPRGLSMGAIGFAVSGSKFQFLSYSDQIDSDSAKTEKWNLKLDLNVAIRTMVINENQAVFNVGGGIVIDSIPENEYEESLLKAKALINAIGGKFNL